MRSQFRMQTHPFVFLLVSALALATARSENKSCISGCSCQPGLKISNCDSPLSLTKQVFANFAKDLITILFENVYIKRIERDAFDDFKFLENVIIENSNIGSIDSRAFDTEELKRVRFSRTSFGEVPSVKSMYLEELIFDDCGLVQVPTLLDLHELTFVNLANNRISSIDENAFGSLSTLEEIKLSNNSISNLPPNAFIKNTLITLNLDHNPLTTIKLNLTSELESLSLQNCKLTSFDRQSAENLALVNTLDLSGNEIEVLPIDAFETMKDLIYLDLSKNKIIEMDDDIFAENSNLAKVSLSNNPLDSLPHFQAKDGKQLVISTLECQNCNLKSLMTRGNPDVSSLENLNLLEVADFSNNQIDNIDGVFVEMHNLKKILLSSNRIKAVGTYAFAKNASIEVLDLSNNPLQPLDPVAFGNIHYVRQLNVTNATLVQLWVNHNAILPKLEQLFAGYNNITYITVDDIKVTPELKVLEIIDNPLVCDDYFKQLIAFLKYKSISQKSIEVQTHEDFILAGTNDIDSFIRRSPRAQWNVVLSNVCGIEAITEDSINDQNELYNESEEDDEDYEEDEDDDEDGDEEDDDAVYDDEPIIQESTSNESNLNLAQTYYVLTISAVFTLTALVVLIVAVAVTLLILKRNKSFNMRSGNLPRVKIPLWHTTLGQKKHSGSVYRPLSEDLSGSCTPIINRYQFKAAPQVHNSIP